MRSVIMDASRRLVLVSPCIPVITARLVYEKALSGVDVTVVTSSGRICTGEHVKSLCILGYWSKIVFPRHLTPLHPIMIGILASLFAGMYAATGARGMLTMAISLFTIAILFIGGLLAYMLHYRMRYIGPGKLIRRLKNYRIYVLDRLEDSLIIVDDRAYVERKPYMGVYLREHLSIIDLGRAEGIVKRILAPSVKSPIER